MIGSGKTTLLNLLCRRLHGSLMTRYRYSGELLFNDAVPNDQVIRSLTSYVVQDDMALLPSLTVRETLHFAAIIRLPNHMSRPQKLARAEQVLAQLGLRHCADTLIGSELIKGISGGEKRRVSIAIQILTDPKVLVLDEPSSGLDANTAHSLMELLQALAEEGRTVICTIHQSRSDLFPLFGNLLLLARGGRMIYSGKASEMMQYFEEAGYPCPIFANPAYLSIVVILMQRLCSRSLFCGFTSCRSRSRNKATRGNVNNALLCLPRNPRRPRKTTIETGYPPRSTRRPPT